MWAYFDTSALVKRYVLEAGRAQVLRLLRRHACVTSAVLPIELRSAFRRRAGEGALAAGSLARLQKRVAADRPYWTLVELRDEVLAGAEALVAVHPLQTLDAIHVASAQLFAARMPISELLFVSADTRQVAAAKAVGLMTSLIPA